MSRFAFAFALALVASPTVSATMQPSCLWPVIDMRPTILTMQSQDYGLCIMRLGQDLPGGKGGDVPMCGDALNGEAFVSVCADDDLAYIAGRFGGLPYGLPEPVGPYAVAVAPPLPAVFFPTPPARPRPILPIRHPIRVTRPGRPDVPAVPEIPVAPSPIPLPGGGLLLLAALTCLKRRKLT